MIFLRVRFTRKDLWAVDFAIEGKPPHPASIGYYYFYSNTSYRSEETSCHQTGPLDENESRVGCLHLILQQSNSLTHKQNLGQRLKRIQ